MPLRVSISGIRGVIGDGLDAEVAARWASAFGRWLPPGPVVIGRDSRPSGPMLLRAVSAALMSTGHDVWDIGIATTPTTEIAVSTREAVGGVILTASHNPQQWNALKLLSGDGLFLAAVDIDKLQKLQQQSGGHATWDKLGQMSQLEGADSAHVDGVLKLPWLDMRSIRRRGLHAVVDAVEGAAGSILPRLLRTLGVVCTPIHCNLTGRFPHDPEPTPKNLTTLSKTVKQTGADLGLAVDPDGDRLALVDGAGTALSEELTLVLAVDLVLDHEPGPVVVNLSTTRLIDEVAARHGAEVTRTAVGEANVVAQMLAKGAVIGGEGNGGVIYPALHAGRDALVGIAAILQLMAEREATLADLAAKLPPAAMVKRKTAADSLPVGENLASVLAGLGPGTIDDRDGLKWTGRTSWIHVRSSNTEPVVRIIAEAETETDAAQLIAAVERAGRS